MVSRQSATLPKISRIIGGEGESLEQENLDGIILLPALVCPWVYLSACVSILIIKLKKWLHGSIEARKLFSLPHTINVYTWLYDHKEKYRKIQTSCCGYVWHRVEGWKYNGTERGGEEEPKNKRRNNFALTIVYMFYPHKIHSELITRKDNSVRRQRPWDVLRTQRWGP